MTLSDSVASFHGEGAMGGALVPVYHFNALATSRLIARGGTLVDLGSGSGQYLAYLALRRPDLRIIGLDLSQEMVATGNRYLAELGLSDRVEIRVGDMTDFKSQLPARVSAVSSVFALHHLPTDDHLRRCLQGIAHVQHAHGCAVWLFDHTRPRHPKTAQLFPELFTPNASPTFRRDSTNSLIAAFSFSELSEELGAVLEGPWQHVQSKGLRLYQAHWLAGRGPLGGRDLWHDALLSTQASRQFRQLRGILRRVPV